MAPFMRLIIVASSACMCVIMVAICSVWTLNSRIYLDSESDASQLKLLISKPDKISNADYLSMHNYTKILDVEETEKLYNLVGKVASIPGIFGYTKEIGDSLFPYYEYPDCSKSAYKTPGSWLSINYQTNSLAMSCPKGSKGRFVSGPIFNVTFTNPVELRKYWKVVDYEGETKLDNQTDWVIGTCGKSNKFELHQHIPRFKLYSYKRSGHFARQMKQSTGSQTQKPLIILVLTADSFSRRHFFRKMPKTIQYLNDLEKGKEWKIFDFKIHNIIGTDTAENQARIFGEKFNGFQFGTNLNRDLFGSDAIWYKMIKSGFVTLLGFDPCAFKLHRVIGRMPKADHVSESFFCANTRFSGYSTKKRGSSNQRCIGHHMSHYYLMNYTLTFSGLYAGRNQWAYNHYAAAHEQTGQHAQTLDKDMVWYLSQYINSFGKDNNIVIFLMGDHGMRYGDFISNTYAIQEHRLPAFFLISQRSFLDTIEYSYDTLSHNTERLVTKPDIRRTLLYLAGYPYNAPEEPKKSSFVNIFKEKIDDNRRCEDAEIPPWYCSAYVLDQMPTYFYNKNDPYYSRRNSTEKELGDLVNKIGLETVSLLNQNVYTPSRYDKGNLCKKLTFKEVTLTIYNVMKNSNIIMKLIVKVNESEKALFDSWIIISEQYDLNTPEGETENYTPFPIVFNGRRLFAKLINVFRADKYGGTCEELAREAELNPEHCLCKDEIIAEIEQLEEIEDHDGNTQR
ncbi:unnamed protein product [Blepharisma stoltei]|uniref:Uncharacterized protein n=1 Tax=Blepharisma stoltei TaxID=1481888 RepID=A0AAU9JIS6_9CILI|nr:unnamed protein product [Blepharisma stoltei]